MCMYTFVPVHIQAKRQLQVLFRCPPPCVFKTRSVIGLDLIKQATLAGQPVSPRTLPVSTSHTLELQGLPSTPSLFYIGSEARRHGLVLCL